MSNSGDSFQRACDLVAEALVRLGAQLQSEDGALALLEMIGWVDVPMVPSALLDLGKSLRGLATARAGLLDAQMDAADGTATDGDVDKALAQIVTQLALVVLDGNRLNDSATTELKNDHQAYLDATGIGTDLTRRLYDRVVYDTLTDSFPLFGHVLIFLGILEENEMEPDEGRHQPYFLLKRVNWNRLGTLFKGPAAIMSDVYRWGTPDLDTQKLFDALQGISLALLCPADVVFPSSTFLQAIAPGAPSEEGNAEPMLVLPIAVLGGSTFAVGVLGAPRADEAEPRSLGFHLTGQGNFDQTLPIADGFSLTVESNADFVAGIGGVLRPGQGFSLLKDPDGQPAQFAGGKAVGRVVRVPQTGEDSIRILSFPGGAFLEAQQTSVSIGAEAKESAPDAFVAAALKGGRVVFPTSDRDGFTKTLTSGRDLDLEFELELGWSVRRGVYLSGSGGLEVAFPVNKTIGPFALQLLRLSIAPASDGLALDVGLVGSAVVGPVTASIDALGVNAILQFKDGNLGPASLHMGFSAPKGYGIAINSESVSGGGFLFFDADAGRYSGALELAVYDLAVQAYGLIETKGDDYSFLIALSVEFTPAIQLGFGFMLTGIGGLLGINRTVDADVLQKTVKNGSVDRLLFPKDVVKNGPQIIKDVSALFPAADGHYVVGPMAKLTWLELITGKLGLFIELPGPRIVLLGTVQVGLPSPEAAIVKLNVDVAGNLDFPKKHLAIDASLRDSVIASYPVSGDMAVRLDWGEKSNFALSVGGLNPAYQAPAGFPKLNRVTVDLAGKGSKPSISLCGYFAITSNTVQLGAKAEIKASGCGISLHGWVEFDALFVLSPFSFTATLDAGVKISFHGYGPTVHLHGELSGPSPYHVKGKVSVSILWWDASLSFSKTFGSGSPAVLPEQNLDGLLRDVTTEIAKAGSWSSTLPANAYVPVRLVSDNDPKSRKLDPVGNAVLCQHVAPFERDLAVWKGVKLAKPVILRLANPLLGGESGSPLEVLREVNDAFAPGQFFTMTNSQKLSAQPFEKMKAGEVYRHSVATTDPEAGDLEYEEYKLSLGTGGIEDPVNGGSPTPDELEAWIECSASATSAVRTGVSEKYVPPNYSSNTTLDQDVYVVCEAATQKVVPAITPRPVSKTAALLALEQHGFIAAVDRSKYVVIQTEV